MFDRALNTPQYPHILILRSRHFTLACNQRNFIAVRRTKNAFFFLLLSNCSTFVEHFNPKKVGGEQLTPFRFFFKNVFSRERLKSCFFVTFDIVSILFFKILLKFLKTTSLNMNYFRQI